MKIMKTKIIFALLYLIASLSAIHIGGWVPLTKPSFYEKAQLLYSLHIEKKPFVANGDFMLFWFNNRYVGFVNKHFYFDYTEIQIVLFVLSLIWFFSFLGELISISFLFINNKLDIKSQDKTAN